MSDPYDNHKPVADFYGAVFCRRCLLSEFSFDEPCRVVGWVIRYKMQAPGAVQAPLLPPALAAPFVLPG